MRVECCHGYLCLVFFTLRTGIKALIRRDVLVSAQSSKLVKCSTYCAHLSFNYSKNNDRHIAFRNKCNILFTTLSRVNFKSELGIKDKQEKEEEEGYFSR